MFPRANNTCTCIPLSPHAPLYLERSATWPFFVATQNAFTLLSTTSYWAVNPLLLRHPGILPSEKEWENKQILVFPNTHQTGAYVRLLPFSPPQLLLRYQPLPPLPTSYPPLSNTSTMAPSASAFTLASALTRELTFANVTEPASTAGKAPASKTTASKTAAKKTTGAKKTKAAPGESCCLPLLATSCH